jgi:DNA polymerase III subunit delta'
LSPSEHDGSVELGFPSPRENPDLFGHENAEREFAKSFVSSRMAHAWLLCGRRGIGKATMAYRIARFVLSRGEWIDDRKDHLPGTSLVDQSEELPNNLAVSDDSQVFRRVAAASHADLMTVELGFSDDAKRKPKREIVVADVRRIAPFFSMTPAEGGWRVVIIDGADLMNRNAMNAVLKVLEEPPPKALLLLVCHNPGRLLPTVRSRCRRLNLNPLSQSIMKDLLARFFPDMAPTDTDLLSRLSEGSFGRALTIAEEGGLELFRDLSGLLNSLPDIEIGSLHTFADGLARPGAENSFLTFTELLQNWLSILVRIGATGDVDNLAINDKDAALARSIIDQGNLDRWFQVWEKITFLLARAGNTNLDRKQVVLTALMSIKDAAQR